MAIAPKNLLLPAFLVLASSLVLLASLRSDEAAGDELEVWVETVAIGTIRHEVHVRGTIQPVRAIEVSSAVVGKVESILVRSGQEVEKGQPVALLERGDLRAALRRAEASLAIARLELERAEAEKVHSRRSRSRAEELSRKGLISEEILEERKLGASNADLALEKARGSLEQVTADLERAEADLGRSTLVSPIAGRVISVAAQVGEVVGGQLEAAGGVLATIADFSSVLVEVEVPEQDVLALRPGAHARVSLDALAGRWLSGRLVAIADAPLGRAEESAATFYAAEIELDEPGTGLRVGMSAEAVLEVEAREEVPLLPVEAVVGLEDAGRAADFEQPAVWLVEDGRAASRTVALGISDNHRVELESGVEMGERVIVGPAAALRRLREGVGVMVVERTESAGHPG